MSRQVDMSKSPPGIRITLPPDLRAWIDAEAEELGCDAATWLRMLAVDARRHGRKLAFPQYGQPRESPLQARHEPPVMAADDAWRGPVDDAPDDANGAAINAIIQRQLAGAEAEIAATAPSPPTEMFARTPHGIQAAGGEVRALSRPAPKYSPAVEPGHLRAL